MNKKVLLMILDGWGIAQDPSVSAIDLAQTPFMDQAQKKYPAATLNTTGLAVGLPEGQMGNSEVGHMNIGAGRVVYQNLARINKDIEDGNFYDMPELQKAMNHANAQNCALHLMGLVSDGGVHSHIHHLLALMDLAHQKGLKKVYIHAFTDGRDCDPKSGKDFIQQVLNKGKETGAQLASVTGRYYAMDRDHRWERTEKAYKAMVKAEGEILTDDAIKAIDNSYQGGITDEFILPIILTNAGTPVAQIKENDVVISFNFRTDRPRQITEVLTQKTIPDTNMKPLDLYYVSMTQYDEDYKGIHIVYQEEDIKNTLGEVLFKAGKQQIRIAETEKYPHVTFFFNGGKEEPFEGEKRILCPSPKEVATYDLKPEMSAYEITEKIIPEINSESADFIVLNFANTDMVGHTGVMSAAIKAAETVDSCAEKITEAALEHGYTLIIIADHGNSDIMINPDGSPNTQHTTNPVPLIVAANQSEYKVKNGKLGDLAPSILQILGIDIPEEMTGEIIINQGSKS